MGKLLKKLKISEGVAEAHTLKTTGGLLRIEALSSTLFRLRTGPGASHSWAVQPPPQARSLNARKAGDFLVLETEDSFLRLKTGSGLFSFGARQSTVVFEVPARAVVKDKRGMAFSLRLREDDLCCGLGETTGPFNKYGLRRELWNVDVLGHAPGIHPDLRSLYISIPFLIVMREGAACGIFWDNPSRQVWDIGQSDPGLLKVSADLGGLDLYLFAGPSVAGITSEFTRLTGRMPLPPRWALGYHQSRYSYRSAKEVRSIAAQFRRRKIPCDAIYLDIDHMDGYRVFTFGRSFSKPARLLSHLAKRGFKTVAIVDPGVKKDKGFRIYREGLKRRAFVTWKGRAYAGRVWPGASVFPDFTRAAVRQWWAGEQAAFQRLGVAGIWNDMNEPANFALPAKTLPPDARHETDFGPATHEAVHNIYGMQMARASREGALQYAPDERPFVISRAGCAGIQRHALVWTGDNSSHWEHLGDSLQMLLNLSLSGVAFCGSDIGGFLGNVTPELLVRWTQMAAFTPFFRNHSNTGTRAQEPWAFGWRVERICRKFIKLRYRLLPFLNNLFIESHLFGTPIIRPLWWGSQKDPVARGIRDEFLLGDQFLVAPILQAGARARAVYLPAGLWHDYWTGRAFEGGGFVLASAPLEVIPLFVRSGSMIPTASVRQWISRDPWGKLELHIWPGRQPIDFVWREEDGFSNAYLRQEIGEYKVLYRKGALQVRPLKPDLRGPAPSFRLVLRVPPP